MANVELPTLDVVFDSETFRLTALPYAKGEEALTKLMNLVGPAFKSLQVGADGDLGAASLGPVLGELFTRISAEQFRYFRELFLERTEVEREGGWVRVPKLGPAGSEKLFAANYGLLVRLIGAHIGLNFKSFLAGALAIARPG